MSVTKVRIRNIKSIQANALKYGDKLASVMEAVVDNNFIQAAGKAKQDAPWTDRTGDARRSIDYRNLSNKDRLAFYLVIGVYYGVYLEFANGGKYRILQPTMTVTEVKIKQDLKRVGVEIS